MSAPLPGGGSRAGRRRQRRQRQRRQLVIALVVAVALALAVTAVLVRRGGKISPGVPPQGRTQSTLLFQLRGTNGQAVSSALLAHDTTGPAGAAVLVPPQVLVTLPGAGSLSFGGALPVGGQKGARDALADLLGVTVDEGWVLDVATAATLVDRVGGVVVDVDVDVLGGPQRRTVVLPAGPQQRLTGEQAVTYVTYQAPGEQEQARLARLQDVLDGLLLALPQQADALRDLLAGLGGGSTTSVPPAQLVPLLLGLTTDVRGTLQYDTLPVVPVDTGGSASLRVDQDATRTLVDRLLAQSIPAGSRSGGNRVLVLNGVGTPGLGTKVRDRLVPAGFVFVDSRNAPRFGYPKTQVLVRDASASSVAAGRRVAEVLGVPASAVATDDSLGSVADIVVLVGADFPG